MTGRDSDYGDGDGEGGLVCAIITMIILTIGMAKEISNKKHPATKGALSRLAPNRTIEIEKLIQQTDPSFTFGKFTSFAAKVYVDIQLAWCNRDLKPVRHLFHDDLYNTTDIQIAEKIRQGVKYTYENITVDNCYLTAYQRSNDAEYLTCYLRARMIDYQTDEKTGKIIRGNKTTMWMLEYKMKFTRSLERKTDGENTICPNCCAPLDIQYGGVCEYCGSAVNASEYDWVLSEFTTLRPNSVDEGIQI